MGNITDQIFHIDYALCQSSFIENWFPVLEYITNTGIHPDQSYLIDLFVL